MNLDSVCGDAEKRSSVFLEPFEPELLLTKNPLRLVLTKAPQTFPFFAHNTNHRLLLIINSRPPSIINHAKQNTMRYLVSCMQLLTRSLGLKRFKLLNKE